jgi:hypothetical protein
MAETNIITSSIKIGTQVSRWTIQGEAFKSGKHYSVNCLCKCGNERIVRVQKLLTGKTRSCGCLRNEELTTHGQTKRVTRHLSHEYWIWNAMIQRCTNKRNKQYPDYGARGITIDEKWLRFEGFIDDMGFRPTVVHSIERVNNSLVKTIASGNSGWIRIETNVTIILLPPMVKIYVLLNGLLDWVAQIQ